MFHSTPVAPAVRGTTGTVSSTPNQVQVKAQPGMTISQSISESQVLRSGWLKKKGKISFQINCCFNTMRMFRYTVKSSTIGLIK